MKRYLLFLFIFCVFTGNAQTDSLLRDSTVQNFELKEVKVTARWKNDTDRYHYNQMKHYVIIILPYLNAATKLFNEINTKMEDENLGRRERKEFISAKEDEMRTSFEDKVRDLNVTQGVLLVKLIARQTNLNIYKIVSEFKNPIVAIKWQSWARLHGLNLDRKYHPEDEPDLENIMDELGYPLPASYAVNNN